MRNNIVFVVLVLVLAGVALPPVRMIASEAFIATYNLVQDEGTPLTRRQTLNCVGAGITCSDSGGKTVLTVPGSATGTAFVYSQSFTAQTTVALAHSLNTLAVQVQCYDGGSPASVIEPASAVLTDANTVTVTFGVAQTGKCVVVGG